VVLAFSASQAAELRLGRVDVLGRAHREAADQVDGNIPEPEAGHAFGGQTDSADALPAFEHAIVRMPIVRSFSIVACGLTAQPLLQPSRGSYH